MAATWSSVARISAKISSIGPIGVDADDVPAGRPVVLDERGGLALVDLQPLADRIGRVVGPVLLGRALRIRSSSTSRRHLELEDDVEVAAELGRAARRAPPPVRCCAGNRRGRTRDRVAAVEPVSIISTIGRRLDELSPRSYIAFTSPADGRVELLDLPDHVPRRDVRDAVGPRDQLRLGSLARSLWSQDEDVHPVLPSSDRNESPPEPGSPRREAPCGSGDR